MHDRISKVAKVSATLLLVAAVALVGVLAVPSVVGAEESFVVLSGSMEPTLQSGDVVVVRSVEPAAVKEGDVITFRAPGDADKAERDRITHRVVEKKRTDSGVVYRTKGDANESPDPWRVQHSQVIGEVWFNVPVVGHVILFAQQPGGQILLIVIPGLLLIGSGLRTLYRSATTTDGETD